MPTIIHHKHVDCITPASATHYYSITGSICLNIGQRYTKLPLSPGSLHSSYSSSHQFTVTNCTPLAFHSPSLCIVRRFVLGLLRDRLRELCICIRYQLYNAATAKLNILLRHLCLSVSISRPKSLRAKCWFLSNSSFHYTINALNVDGRKSSHSLSDAGLRVFFFGILFTFFFPFVTCSPLYPRKHDTEVVLCKEWRTCRACSAYGSGWVQIKMNGMRVSLGHDVEWTRLV
jgi:hypothetical protein